MDKLVQRTKEEIEKLKKNGAEQKDIEKFVAETSRQTQVSLKTNEFWRGYLDDSNFIKVVLMPEKK